MVQTLESIKGGGGSIKVGTTGTIGSLMTRELESLKSVPAAPVTPRRRSQMAAAVSVPCGTFASKVLQPSQTSSNEASSSSSNSNTMEDATPQKNLATSKKPKSGISKNGHRVPPMISLDGISTPAAKTPNRNKKVDKKGSFIVEVVDIHCGHPEKAWVTNRLKKLGFSKLSDSVP